MFTDLLIYAWYYPSVALIGLIPTGHLPSTVISALSYFVPYYKYALEWFPVDTMLSVVLMMLGTEAIFIIWWVVMRIVHLIRG